MIGASIGSFLNALIYRLPRGLKISEPRNSFCPSCKARLGIPDLIPLFSWLFLRGKCRHCKTPIAARYFWVEVITGSLFAVVWHLNLVDGWDPWRAVCLAAFIATLLAAFFIDLRHYIIPDQVNACLFVVGVLYNVGLYALGDDRATTWGVPSALAGALVGVGVLWGIAFLGRLFLGKDAMGHGDIKMARGMGAMLFPIGALMSFAMAVTFGAVAGIVFIVVQRVMAARNPEPVIEDEEEEEDFPPETLGSLLKCGAGYVLCIDVIGLFLPKLYEGWFGENPYALEDVEEDDSWVGPTTIPFGPSLALGAIVVALAEPTLVGWMRSYWDYATGGGKF